MTTGSCASRRRKPRTARCAGVREVAPGRDSGDDGQDFPLPTRAPALRALCNDIVNGRGFTLIRGLAIEDLPAKDAALIYWGIGSHFGRGQAQNAQGDMLGHVTDLGVDYKADPNVRGYQTRLRLPFHNDTADIVGLLCVTPARSGGLSRVVSSTAIHNAVSSAGPTCWTNVLADVHGPPRGDAARQEAVLRGRVLRARRRAPVLPIQPQLYRVGPALPRSASSDARGRSRRWT